MKTKYILIIILVLLSASCKHTPPKILIIGDSISLGYTPFVKELLGDMALVIHNPGNAQHTGTGLLKIEEWIGEEDWDIIQFNWGLWDLAYRHGSSNVQGKRDKVNGKITFTPDKYMTNLDSIVTRMKEMSKAKFLFVTTSYVPEGESGRYVKDALVFNDLAKKIMQKHNIRVNDFYDFSKEVHEKYGTAPDNVHFTKEGYKILADNIIEWLSKIERRIKAE